MMTYELKEEEAKWGREMVATVQGLDKVYLQKLSSKFQEINHVGYWYHEYKVAAYINDWSEARRTDEENCFERRLMVEWGKQCIGGLEFKYEFLPTMGKLLKARRNKDVNKYYKDPMSVMMEIQETLEKCKEKLRNNKQRKEEVKVPQGM